MSLYYEAAPMLESASIEPGSFKSRVFGSQNLKSAPTQIFALLSETSKWSPTLTEVIERSQLLRHEKKVRTA